MSTTTESELFSVKTPVYEGPLELLIQLVEKRKLLINDISLAEVTDEYMRQVAEMQERSLPNTAQFVQLAATLLLIKSKSLLPVLDLTQEEETAIDDLSERLKIYQVYRQGGMIIQNHFGKKAMYGSTYVPPNETYFLPDKYCSTFELRDAINRVIDNLPKPSFSAKASVKKTISLEEMIDRVRSRIERQMRTKFSELRAGETEKANIVISFLAVLELVKQETILVKQNYQFDDIEIELRQSQTPRYY
ncbi:segregation/condensation protein A [Candidatus Kaiserbacteria bacterium]|nr:segregation/condensation protein A [Candidatus Kaiserbacteria bacterium]